MGELCKSFKIRILEKSRYSDILGKFGVPKFTLTGSLNVIFPRLKFSSLKYLWDLMGVDKITKRIVREVMAKIFFNKKSGNKT